jgi:hypothetical protein
MRHAACGMPLWRRWPANRRDLDPMEMLWSMLWSMLLATLVGREFAGRDVIFDALREVWGNG